MNNVTWTTSRINSVQPDFIILDVGTNDVSADDCSSTRLANRVSDAARSFYELIGSVFSPGISYLRLLGHSIMLGMILIR